MIKKLRKLFNEVAYRMTLIGTVEQHVKNRRLIRWKTIFTAMANLHYLIRFLLLLVALYTADLTWIKHDHLFRSLYELKLKVAFLVSMFAGLVFVIVSSAFLCQHALFQRGFAFVYELIKVNFVDIVRTNPKQYKVFKKCLSPSGWFHHPVETVRLVKQLTLSELVKSELHLNQNFAFTHFPLVFRKLRFICITFWIAWEVFVFALTTTTILGVSFFVSLVLFQNLYIFESLVDGADFIFLIIYFVFNFRFLFLPIFLFAYIYAIIIFVFAELNRQLMAIGKPCGLVRLKAASVGLFMKHHKRVSKFTWLLNQDVSLFISIFIYLNLPMNLQTVSTFVVIGFGHGLESWTLVSIWTLNMLSTIGIVVFNVTISKRLYSCQRYLVPLQLKRMLASCSLAFKWKFASYYERMNTHNPVTTQIYGLGEMTASNLVNFLFLYFVFFIFTINLLHS